MTTQITLFHHGPAANPPKVAILLEELGISYNPVYKEFGDGENGVKAPNFLSINPNGRVPAIIDHTNNDKVVWESGAILLYLAEKFDKSGTYSGKTLNEKAVIWEWLMFQVSGLGPMLGQFGFFKFYHPVKNLDQSLYDRFENETLRIFSVLEKRLENKEWIALDKFTIVDMAIYPWLTAASRVGISYDKFPRLKAYFDRISKLSSVETVYKKLQSV